MIWGSKNVRKETLRDNLELLSTLEESLWKLLKENKTKIPRVQEQMKRVVENLRLGLREIEEYDGDFVKVSKSDLAKDLEKNLGKLESLISSQLSKMKNAGTMGEGDIRKVLDGDKKGKHESETSQRIKKLISIVDREERQFERENETKEYLGGNEYGDVYDYLGFYEFNFTEECSEKLKEHYEIQDGVFQNPLRVYKGNYNKVKMNDAVILNVKKKDLPSALELEAIYLVGKDIKDSLIFWEDDFFWSSSSYKSFSDRVWAVNLKDGGKKDISKKNKCNLIYVYRRIVE